MNKKRKEAVYCRTNNLYKPLQEGIAWTCTGWLWDAALGHSVTLIHETRCPSMCEATFTRKETISSISSIIIGKRRRCLQGSLGVLKIKGFPQILSAQLTRIQGKAAVWITAMRKWTYKGFWDTHVPYFPFFPQAIHIVMVLRHLSWLQGQTWTKVSNKHYICILFLCQLI